MIAQEKRKRVALPLLRFVGGGFFLRFYHFAIARSRMTVRGEILSLRSRMTEKATCQNDSKGGMSQKNRGARGEMKSVCDR